MRVVVLNGSPKGEDSITRQVVRRLELRHPEHRWTIHHVARRILGLERRQERFDAVLASVREADLVLWSFGVWVMCVSAQLMRFVELVRERGVADAFEGRHAAALSTSIHYFDHAAHAWVQGTSEDLGMRFVESLSLDIMDIATPGGRRQVDWFGERVFDAVRRRAVGTRRFSPLPPHRPPRPPGGIVAPLSREGLRVVVVADTLEPGSGTEELVERFGACLSPPPEVVDLAAADIRGACLGCMRCGQDFTCPTWHDGFRALYDDVRTADVIVFAGAMRGRWLSSRLKTFFDRGFVYNHTPSMAGRQIGFLVSGPLSHEANLRELLEATATARQDASFAGAVSDEVGGDALQADLRELARRAVVDARAGRIKPKTFPAVGGHLVFRDNIWGRLRPIWRADHRAYRRLGKYDFPQRRWLRRIGVALMTWALSVPWIRRRFLARLRSLPAARTRALVERTAHGWALLLALGLTPLHPVTGELRIDAAGPVHVFAVDEAGFATPMQGRVHLVLAPSPEDVERGSVPFELALPPGTWGLRCFVDVDGDGRLARGLFGPAEPWGMSFRGRRPPGPPRFADIAFDVPRSEPLHIDVTR